MKHAVILGGAAHRYNLQQRLNGAYAIYRHLSRAIVLAPNDVVLDIGCGTGTVLFRLNEKYPDAKLHGIDPSPDMIAIAKEKDVSGTIDFQVGFGETLSFPDASVDCVISSLTTHHMSTEARLQMVSEVKRVLKPQGRFFLTDFHMPETLLGRVALKLFLGRHAYIPELVLTPNRTLLEENGFTILRAEPQRPLAIAEHIEAELA